MRKAVYAFTTVLLGTLALTTGCTTKKQHQRDVSALQSQIGSLQGEIGRLDQSLRDTDTALKSAKEQRIAPTAATGSGSLIGQFTSGAIYRTPSGFELPAAGIQQALKKAGYYQGAVDGKVGSRTKEAIRNFQKDQGLEADGVCGRQTWARLQSFA